MSTLIFVAIIVIIIIIVAVFLYFKGSEYGILSNDTVIGSSAYHVIQPNDKLVENSCQQICQKKNGTNCGRVRYYNRQTEKWDPASSDKISCKDKISKVLEDKPIKTMAVQRGLQCVCSG